MISRKEIMQIVKEYAKSPEGKKKIKEVYGVEYEEKVNKSALKKYGEQMKEILFKHISPLIGLMKPSDIVVGEVKATENGYALPISFREESLRRESLYTDGYWGDEELQNIVLLFTKGYHARDYVYGYWTNSKHGLSVWQDRTRSRKDREPNPFLKEAVSEFNNATDDFVTAVLEEKYNDEDS